MARVAAFALLFLGGGCDGCEPEQRASAPPDVPAQRPAPEVVYAPEAGGWTGRAPPSRTVPAFVRDRDFDGAERVAARRLVYRVRFRVPATLGNAPATLPRPGAELVLDLSEQRLRATFRGGGWPVHEGAQVRLRRDETGVYVFDGNGGRPLGPGQLASWFQGGRVLRTPMVRIRAPPPAEQSGPGSLLCRLLAEWSNQPPEPLARRCGKGGSLPNFRIGPWSAERTADVAVELPRRALRADEKAPPGPIAARSSATFLAPRHLSRLEPRYRKPHYAPPDGAPDEGLVVINDGRSRVIVVVGGVPIGWVDRGARVTFAGLKERGIYRLGAMRPLGLPALTARSITLPATLSLER